MIRPTIGRMTADLRCSQNNEAIPSVAGRSVPAGRFRPDWWNGPRIGLERSRRNEVHACARGQFCRGLFGRDDFYRTAGLCALFFRGDPFDFGWRSEYHSHRRSQPIFLDPVPHSESVGTGSVSDGTARFRYPEAQDVPESEGLQWRRNL